MTVNIRAAAFLSIASISLFGELGAQGQRPEQLRTVVAVEHWRLEPGHRLRIYTDGVGFVEGSLVAIQDQELMVRSGGTQTAVRLAWVDSLWVETTATRRWASYGSIGGTVIGAVAGALLCGSGCDDRTLAVALGSGIGAASGALTGGIAGSRRRIWSRRYP